MKTATCDTNLTDAPWACLQPLLPKPANCGRPPKARRRLLAAILYLAKRGCPWRSPPAGFPRWKTVCHVFRQWVAKHPRAVIHDTLRVLVRRQHGKRRRPAAASRDGQSVRSAGHGGRVGSDAAKRIKGRKRHLLADAPGLILRVAVTPASTTGHDGAPLLLGPGPGWSAWRRLLWMHGGCTGETFAQGIKGLRPKLAVASVQRSAAPNGFKVLPSSVVSHKRLY